MKLYLNESSPFARLVLVTAIECGNTNIKLRWIDPWESSKELTDINPYSMIPTLVFDDGTSLYESSIICEHFIAQNKIMNKLSITGNYSDLKYLKLFALSKNLMDISYRKVISDRFHKETSQISIRSNESLGRALIKLEEYNLSKNNNRFDSLSEICLAVSLKYIKFRMPAIYSTIGDKTKLWIEKASEIDSLKSTNPDKLTDKPRNLLDLVL